MKLTMTKEGYVFLDDTKIPRCLSVEINKITPLKGIDVTLHVNVKEVDVQYMSFVKEAAHEDGFNCTVSVKQQTL